jgi:phage terminase small subunit/phage terminase Nu1 subunit (DNA packaging protein)
VPEPPEWFSPSQRESWARACAQLAGQQILASDEALLIAWSVADDQYRTAAALQAKLDSGSQLPMITKNASGRPGISPYLKIIQQAGADLSRLSIALKSRTLTRAVVPEASALVAEGDALLVSKRELCGILNTTGPTLSAWINKYGDRFPVARVGSKGTEYLFDPAAVIEFLRGEQQRQQEQRAQRDEALAQLILPLGDERSDESGAPSLEDQIKAARLNQMRVAEAERAGKLVQSDMVIDLFSRAFADLSRDARQFVGQLGREQSAPQAVIDSWLMRLAEVQEQSLRRALANLVPPQTPRAEAA